MNFFTTASWNNNKSLRPNGGRISRNGSGERSPITWCLDSSGRLLTIFSASRYAGRFSNSGGVAVLHHGTGPTEASLSLRFLGRDWTWWVQMTSFFRTMPLVSKKKKFFSAFFRQQHQQYTVTCQQKHRIVSEDEVWLGFAVALRWAWLASITFTCGAIGRSWPCPDFDAGAEQESRWSAVVAFNVEGFLESSG